MIENGLIYHKLCKSGKYREGKKGDLRLIYRKEFYYDF